MRRLLMITAAVIVVLGAEPTPAAAQRSTGNDLIQECRKAVRHSEGNQVVEQDAIDAGYCLGLVHGYRDMRHYYLQDLFCPPNSVNDEQMARVVVKYLEEHPAELDERHSAVLVKALQAAWPCQSP